MNKQELTESIENLNAKSLKYWLSKFVQEVANNSGERYPSRTLYSIVCGLKRFLVVKNGEGELNPLAVRDKRYLNLRASLCKILIWSFAHKMDFAHNFSVDFF